MSKGEPTHHGAVLTWITVVFVLIWVNFLTYVGETIYIGGTTLYGYHDNGIYVVSHGAGDDAAKVVVTEETYRFIQIHTYVTFGGLGVGAGCGGIGALIEERNRHQQNESAC